MKHAIIAVLMLWSAVLLTFGVAAVLETVGTAGQEARDART